jgi:hypothetical protein
MIPSYALGLFALAEQRIGPPPASVTIHGSFDRALNVAAIPFTSLELNSGVRPRPISAICADNESVVSLR